jgi:hypothetical protein
VTNEVWSAALGLGFALGLRHALDPDHLAAVSTIVSESRSIWRSSLVGASWGLGLVGLIHGFAGSAGLMILILGTIPSAIAGLVYLAMFGLGSTGGMLLMSSLLSLPFVWTAGRFHLFTQTLQVLVGCGSIIFGCLYALHQFSLPH